MQKCLFETLRSDQSSIFFCADQKHRTNWNIEFVANWIFARYKEQPKKLNKY